MKNIAELYPWQKNVWQLLNQDKRKLHHAFLLHGRAGTGKYDFAISFSKALLCLNPTQEGFACGVCSSCSWFNDETHPDFRLLSPEQEGEAEDDAINIKKSKKKTQISVAQIRDLNDFLSLSSHRSNGLRVVLIHPAESLNLASANALLKMLEEPASGVIFILVAHQLQRLLPTVISRCQKVSMPIPDEGTSLAWLEVQGVQNAKQQLSYLEGSPIRVLDEQLQFSQVSEIWKLLALGVKLEPHVAAASLTVNSAELGVIAVQKWLYDLIAVRLGAKIRYHEPLASTLQSLAGKVNLTKFFELQKKTNELRKLASHPLNHELQIESLLIDYTKLFKAQ